MQSRSRGYLVVAFLLAVALAGGVFVFVSHTKASSARDMGVALAASLERMILAVSDVAAAQQAYIAPGQPEQPWLERSTALLQQLSSDVTSIRTRLQSADAVEKIDAVDRGVRALVGVDQKAHADVAAGQTVLAADRIFSEGRDASASLIASLDALRASELVATASRQTAAEHEQWASLGGIALVWLVGLLILIPRRDAALAQPAESPARELSVPPALSGAADARSAVDLAAAANVCSVLARLTDAAALQDVLRRASEVLGARGVVVWIGAGDELFPVIAHGYDERLLPRLGPISRAADNVTAEAWRSGLMRTVPADATSYGAIAAPLPGITGCIGVFAAEVPQGREGDAATQAVAAIFAAQLAGVLPASPPAASPPGVDTPSVAASSRH